MEPISESTAFLLKQLKSNDKKVIVTTLKALGYTNTTHDEVLGALVHFAEENDYDSDIKAAAIEALTCPHD